jgi:sarcosine oxidase subunit gamma
VTDEARARSPLAGRAADLAALDGTSRGGVVAAEVPFLSQIDVRTDTSNARRLALPTEPNTVVEAEDRSVLWLGPDEWLVVAAPGRAGPVAEEIAAALSGVHHSVVDVSANRAVIDVAGTRGRDVLSKGCPLDLHPRVWRPGMCAQSLLGRAQALLHERPLGTRLYVRPSFGDYVVDWLIDAAREYAEE